jgi:hypothetical protein
MRGSLCKKYYEIFICQGLLVGVWILSNFRNMRHSLYMLIIYQVATALMYQPSITVLSHYFEKRRALAMGISTSGASLGGVLYPSKYISFGRFFVICAESDIITTTVLLNHLFAKVGFAWGVRAGK